jgi:hypothetical protein
MAPFTTVYRVYCSVGEQCMLVGTDVDLRDAYKRCTAMENMEQWHIKMYHAVKEELEEGAVNECIVSYTDPKEGEKKITFLLRRAVKQD